MDAFAKVMEKRKLIEPNLLKRVLFNYEKKQLYRYEAEVFDFVDKFCIISNQDKNAIQSPRSKEIHCIPNGVDFDTFYPKSQAKKYDLLFMGNLGYPPNIAAIDFLLHEIFPLVVQQKPDVKLLIAGINASNRLKKTQSVNIDVIEHFEDISDSIALSKVMLAPMTISIGLQNKILQAMAMKTPCIVSTLSNNAINAPQNKAIIEANTPEEFTHAIIELLSNEQKALEIGEEGYKFVKEHYSWERQNDLFTQLILQHN
jgi:glycosyltransferase involved in cell wall biosynthesis